MPLRKSCFPACTFLSGEALTCTEWTCRRGPAGSAVGCCRVRASPASPEGLLIEYFFTSNRSKERQIAHEESHTAYTIGITDGNIMFFEAFLLQSCFFEVCLSRTHRAKNRGRNYSCQQSWELTCPRCCRAPAHWATHPCQGGAEGMRVQQDLSSAGKSTGCAQVRW